MTDNSDRPVREIPKFLAKHGITRVTDNVPEGRQVRPPPHLLFTLFEPEFMAAFTRPSRGNQDETPD